MRTGFGDDDLRLGPMKIFFDGALSSRTAAMTAPFRDRDHAGYFQDDPAHMHEMVVGAHLAGWTVAAHAIGDRAVAAALDAFADAQVRRPDPEVRHRIEHAGVVSDAEVLRFAALGVTPVPQARFLHEIGDSMVAAVGDERADLLYRHASFLRAGVRVPASSDRPCVADGHPLRDDAGDGDAALVVGAHDRSGGTRGRGDRAALADRRHRLDRRRRGPPWHPRPGDAGRPRRARRRRHPRRPRPDRDHRGGGDAARRRVDARGGRGRP